MHNSLVSKLLVRLLLLFALVTAASIVVLTKCGFDELTARETQPNSPSSEASGFSYALSEREAAIERLKQEVLSLRTQILFLQNNRSGVKPSAVATNGSLQLQLQETTVAPSPLSHHYDCSSYIRKQVGAAEILHGLPLNNEYELIPYNHFTFTRVYPIDLGLGKRVVEKPIGYRRRDLIEAVNKALESLNRNHSARIRAKAAAVPAGDVIKYTLDDFIEGIYRTEPTTGTQYELYFQSVKHQASPVRRALVMRPFAPLQTVQLSELTPNGDTPSQGPPVIHVILPLAGRLHSFRSFLQMFAKLEDRRLELIVVYFGVAGLDQARRMAGRSERTQFLALNETFSRGKQEGF